MIEQEQKDKIIEAIKNGSTEVKPQLSGLFHHLMTLYVAEEKLKQGNLVLNGTRNVKITDYTDKVTLCITQG